MFKTLLAVSLSAAALFAAGHPHSGTRPAASFNADTPVWLSDRMLTPSKSGGASGKPAEHAHKPADTSKKPAEASKKPEGASHGGGHGFGAKKQLWAYTDANGGEPRCLKALSGTVLAFDNGGESLETELTDGRGCASIAFVPPRADYYSLYYLSRAVTKETLFVNNAKYELLYGTHGDKTPYDPERMKARSFDPVPFDILRLRDEDETSFFQRFTSGDTLRFRILLEGTPLAGVPVTLKTDGGWSKTVRSAQDGSVSFQLIKEYFPEWGTFDKRHQNRFLVSAAYTDDAAGIFEGSAYTKRSFIATFPGSFYPERSAYLSYAYALAFGTAALLLSGAAVYFYRRRRHRPFTEVSFDEKA